jgi:hypothetical protein
MDAPSPARLYAALAGALLLAFGILGFFYSASFGTPGEVDEALGAFRCNAWVNLLHVVTGAMTLLLATAAPRACALLLGWLYTALGIWGIVLGSGAEILGFLPTGTGNDALHLTLGVLGLLAAAGTPSARTKAKRKRPRGNRDRRVLRTGARKKLQSQSKPRAKRA